MALTLRGWIHYRLGESSLGKEALYPLEDDELEQKIVEWRSSYQAQQVSLDDLIETTQRTEAISSPRIETPQRTEYKPGLPIPNDFELTKKLENHKLYHLTAFGVLFTVVRRNETCTWAAKSTLEGPDGYGTGTLEQFLAWYRRNATREERAAAMPDWEDLESLEFDA